MMRRVVDARGTEWVIWEVGARVPVADRPEPPRRYLVGPEPTWLCFESPTQRRRLERYPSRWHAMESPALAALCDAAQPAYLPPPWALELD